MLATAIIYYNIPTPESKKNKFLNSAAKKAQFNDVV